MVRINKQNFAIGLFISFLAFVCIGKLFISAPIMFFAFALAIASFFFGDDNYCICFAMFLVPNIRIMDTSRLTVLTNIMLLTPVLARILRVRKINFTAMTHTVLLITIDFIHVMYNQNYEDLVPNIGSIIVLYYIESVLLDRNTVLRLSQITRMLAFGAIFSAALYYVSYARYTDMSRFMRGYRYAAYASDPNYYSLYICLAIAMLMILKQHKLYDYFMIFILIGIEFFTISKMAILIIVLIFIYFTAKTVYNGFSRKTKFFRRLLIVAAVLMSIFSQFIVHMIDRLIVRSGITASDSVTLDTLTTRRSTLQLFYLGELITNPLLLIFGYGVHYTQFYGTLNISHNTFLDIILSWGLIGLAVFISIFFTLIRGLIRICPERITTDHFLPLAVLFITFFALSCVSASMFWWIICASLLSLRGIEENDRVALYSSSGIQRSKLRIRLRRIPR